MPIPSKRWKVGREVESKFVQHKLKVLKIQGTKVGTRIAASTFKLCVQSTAGRAGQMAVLLNSDWLR